MATIKASVEARVGDTTNVTDLVILYNQCLKIVFTKLILVDRNVLYRMSTTASNDTEVNVGSTEANSVLVLGVQRGSFPAKEVPREKIPYFDSSLVAGSIYTPTNIHPVWHWTFGGSGINVPEGGRITTLPAPDSTDKVIVEYVDYDSLEASSETSATELERLPREVGYIVIVCTSMKACMDLMLNETIPSPATTFLPSQLSEIPDLVTDASIATEISALGTFITTDEDVQLAQAQAGKVTALIQSYGESLKEFQGKLTASDKEIQKFNADLNKYSSRIQVLMQVYQSLVQEYMAFWNMPSAPPQQPEGQEQQQEQARA